jgi:outer membrane protein assembly factor BamB
MRRRLIVGAVLPVAGFLLATVVHGGAGSAAATSSPWAQTDYNAAQSRANLTETTLTASNVGRVQYRRSVAAPLISPSIQGCADLNIHAPALTGGNLYAITSNQVSKYSAATGNLLWRSTPDPTFSTGFRSLAVAGGLVVVGGSGCDSVSDPNGFLHAFSAATGASVWSTTMTPGNGPLTTMAVSGAYVIAAGDSAGGGNVVSVHKLTNGALVWSRTTNECAPGDAVVVASTVVSYSCNLNTNAETLVANTLTGAKAWSRSGNWRLQRGDIGGPAGTHLYATNPSGTVVDLNPVSGQTVYSLKGAKTVLAVDNTRVYATCNGLCAYRTSNGAQVWSRPGLTTDLAAEAGGVFYLSQGLALNAATGKTLTTVWAEPNPGTALAVGDGRIAVVADPRVLDLFGLPGS